MIPTLATTVHSIPDGLQSFTAMAVFVVVCAVPLYHIVMWYREPSLLHRRPWRVVLALVVLAVVAPVAGFVLTAALTLIAGLVGWSLFSGDAGFRALFVLIAASALYLLSAIVVALVTLLGAGRKKPG